MKNKWILLNKKAIIWISVSMLAAACGTALYMNGWVFDIENMSYAFFLALFILSYAADTVLRSHVIAVLRERFPLWQAESLEMGRTKKVWFFLSPPQEEKLHRHMEGDEYAEQLKSEYRYYERVSTGWRCVPAIAVLILILAG